jgi:hypothetical protein
MFAKPHLAFIGNNSVKPTLKLVRPLQLTKFPIGFYEHFLGDILRFLIITYLMIGIRVYHFLVSVDQKGKRRLVTFKTTTDKYFII